MFYENVPGCDVSAAATCTNTSPIFLSVVCGRGRAGSERLSVPRPSELRAGGLNRSQQLVSAACGETKGSASSDKHTARGPREASLLHCS